MHWLRASMPFSTMTILKMSIINSSRSDCLYMAIPRSEIPGKWTKATYFSLQLSMAEYQGLLGQLLRILGIIFHETERRASKWHALSYFSGRSCVYLALYSDSLLRGYHYTGQAVFGFNSLISVTDNPGGSR
jgi:hypothetical protein